MAYTDPFNVAEKTTTGVIGRKMVDFGWSGTFSVPEYGQVRDTNAMSGEVAKNFMTNANRSVQDMTDTARTGVNDARQAQLQNNAVATQIGYDADALRALAPVARKDANTQRGYAANFTGMAGDAQAQAAPWLSMGSDIRDLNAGATGIAGEWVKNYNAFSPDSLVSFAASDAQRSIENTRGQMARTLSRSGVSLSSPAYMAALGEARKYENALLAGVKSRARLLGLKEQSGALAQGLQMAISSTGMGEQFTKQALTAIQSASSATSAATGAEAQGGGMLAQAGGLEAQGAGVRTQGAQLALSANNSLASAQQVAADYYSTQASSVLGLLQSGGGGTLSYLFS